MRTVAVVQARMGSTRLPCKSLLCLGEKPLIDWVADRAKKSLLLDDVVVACPDTELDDVLCDHLARRHIPFIRGPEQDVLARFVLAAEQYRADQVVRICADNPFVWWEAVDRLIRFHAGNGADYSYNHVPKDNLWPDGLGAEIVAMDLLRRLAYEAHRPQQREHCLNYIWDNREKFRTATFDPAEEWLQRPDIRLDIDTAQDFCRMSRLAVSSDISARELVELHDARDDARKTPVPEGRGCNNIRRSK